MTLKEKKFFFEMYLIYFKEITKSKKSNKKKNINNLFKSCMRLKKEYIIDKI